MHDRSPVARLREFVEAATRIFIAKGYRRTQMADVTAALGLSTGAIYRYVESKEALFDLCLRHAVDPAQLDGIEALPAPSPEPGRTLAWLEEAMGERGRIESLERAVAGKSPANVPAELETILRELYAKMARYRSAMVLVENCALDWPQLARLWFEGYRRRVMELIVAYLRSRIDAGALHPVADPMATARLIVEVLAFQAMNRHYDPDPIEMDDRTAEEAAVELLLRAHVRSTG